MGIIEDFLARYRKEYDFYSAAGRLVAQILESNLQAAGIRGIVTYRAKSIGRLETKSRQRAVDKDYRTVEDIFADIVDLAGVRIALYFPGERDQVDHMISRLFVQVEPAREFPLESTPLRPKRFSGYAATHYRVQLREQDLSEPDRRYAEARVEIQVASVLMHAWAEVEHDLVYKPMDGQLSDDEYAILDELNGMVLAGEIALERLQAAAERRVAAGGRRFANHYDLAAHILSRASNLLRKEVGDSGLGRVDVLYDFLRAVGIDTPDKLSPHLDALHTDIERRPVAEQIIDRILAEDDSRYETYEEIRARRHSTPEVTDRASEREAHEQIGRFLARWIEFERLVRSLLPDGVDRAVMPSARVLERLDILDPEMRWEIDSLRRLRNNLVHGVDLPNLSDLYQAQVRLQRIIDILRH
ncbi:MAG TPA: RelA/SpoT domain-containing protein [Acidimicrobiales bacterium]|nr:RelA/SpoT domain-containing protein [Acidimicrobiales bacterium]